MPEAAKPSLTQQMLAEARQLQAGRGSLAVLGQFVDQLLAGITQAQVQFVQDASGNPEVPQESVPLVMEAFARLQLGLEHMQTAVHAEDVDAVLEGAALVDEASSAIRAARDEYQQALAQSGQTPFPFINRVLLHAEHLASGGYATHFAIAVLQELPDFLERLQRDVAVQEERSPNDIARRAAEAAVAEVVAVCQGFYNALGQWAQASDRQKAPVLQQVSQRLRAAADQLAQALSAYVETDLAKGPTPILAVNLVIRSAENWQRGIIGAEEFRKVLNQGQTAMHQLMPELPLAEAQAAADQLELVLARMEEALLDAGLEGVLDLMPTLQSAAQDLAQQARSAAGMSLDDEEVVDFVDAGGQKRGHGLPENLQHLLDLAQGYLAGQVEEQTLVFACDQFDRSSASTHRKMARLPGVEALLPPLEKGLQLLQEATQSLRTLPQNPDRRVLDAARSLMTQASERLFEVGQMQV